MSCLEELWGYRVASADDVESARRHLRSSRPDLLLLDLYLDGPDGWKVLRDIKRQHPHLPVIIFTAYDSYLDDPRLSQADGYVIKSIDLGELKQKVADVLKHKAAREESVHQHQWAEGNLSFWPGYLSQQPLPPEGHTLEHWE